MSRGSLLPLTLFSFIGVQTDRGIRRFPFTLNNATVSLFYIKSANCTMIQMMSGLGFKLMIFYLTLLLIVLFTTLFCIMHSGVNLIVKTLFYILSTGSKAIPVLWQFFQTWDTPEKTRSADWQPIADLIQPLGLHTKRAKMLIQFSGKFEQELRG